MNPFVLSRNAFNMYCSEYVNTNSSTVFANNSNNNQSTIDIHSSGKATHSNLSYERAVSTLNQRYEYFLQTLERLRASFEQTTRNHNINSISNSVRDTSTLSSATSIRSNKNRLYKSNKRRMPKIAITVSCAEHFTQQQPNIKMN